LSPNGTKYVTDNTEHIHLFVENSYRIPLPVIADLISHFDWIDFELGFIERGGARQASQRPSHAMSEATKGSEIDASAPWKGAISINNVI
jgi:hypothetical protein